MHWLHFACLLVGVCMLIAEATSTATTTTTTTTTKAPLLHEVIRTEAKQRNKNSETNGNAFIVCTFFGFDVSTKGKNMFSELVGDAHNKVTTQGRVNKNKLFIYSMY